MTEQDIIDAAEYADIRWDGADVPLGWLRHFLDALGKQQEERNFCPRCGKRAGKNDWDVHTCSLPEPEQEPVRREQKMFMDEQEFYTTPPQRKPLTDEEIDRRLRPTNNEHEHDDRFWDGVEWAKAQLKEKNT